MTLNPRFTNRSIRQLFEAHQIDLMKLAGDAITDDATRVKITIAGHPDAAPADVASACDDLTPGEHIDLLTEALRRDLIPASIREATARAAAPDKSAP
ncbi:MAG: hypothetical protein V4726_05665 [Verrucomicrobiota bacterium]